MGAYTVVVWIDSKYFSITALINRNLQVNFSLEVSLPEITRPTGPGSCGAQARGYFINNNRKVMGY